MKEQTPSQEAPKATVREIHKNTQNNAIYGIGIVGAVIYYISTAASFWGGVLGILKAILWPGFMVYELMKFLAM